MLCVCVCVPRDSWLRLAQSFYYPSATHSPGGFVLVDDEGNALGTVSSDCRATDGAELAGQPVMELPIKFYSDTAILQRESNRFSPAVLQQCDRMWFRLARWFGLNDRHGLSKAAYTIVFSEFARGACVAVCLRGACCCSRVRSVA